MKFLLSPSSLLFNVFSCDMGVIKSAFAKRVYQDS